MQSDLKQKLDRLEKRQNSVSLQSTLPAPLPEVISSKVSRQVNYSKTKKGLRKWTPFIREMKDQDSVQFPLVAPKTNLTTESLITKFTPENEMELEIKAILESSGLPADAQREQTDSLPETTTTEKDILQRRGELIKMKNLLFYQDLRAKRQGKIKSKSYRRLLRKQKEKSELNLEELQTLDPELAKMREEELEVARIEERMKLRHTKGVSKFSRGSNMQSLGVRGAIEEQLQLKDKLRKKIKSMDDNESEDEQNEESEQKTPEDSLTEPKNNEPALPTKGLLAMKFMQRGVLQKRSDDFDEQEKLDKAENDPEFMTHAHMLKQGKKYVVNGVG